MKPLHQIGLGLLVAGGLLGVLQWWVSGEAGAGSDAPAQRPELPPDTGAGVRQVLRDLQGLATGFDLAVRADRLPTGCAPILAVGDGGSLRIVTPAPLSRAPASRHWPQVGVLLPAAQLAELSAAERASLLSIWSWLGRDQRLSRSAIRLHGCRARPGEIEQLLRWLR